MVWWRKNSISDTWEKWGRLIWGKRGVGDSTWWVLVIIVALVDLPERIPCGLGHTQPKGVVVDRLVVHLVRKKRIKF